MEIKINNATIDFEYQLAEEDFMGDSVLEVSKEIMIQFINEHNDHNIDLSKYVFESEEYSNDEIVDFSEYSDDLSDWIDGGIDEDFHTGNADLQIVLFYWLIDEDKEPIELKYYGENPYWLLHDICHSRNDVSGFEVYVDKFVEEERIFDGMELAKELDLLAHVNCDLITSVQKGFKDRWEYDFDADRAVQYLNENS